MSDLALDLVPAVWVGYPAELPDRSVLIPGESIREIPREEAEASDNWRLVETTADAEPTGEDAPRTAAKPKTTAAKGES